MAGPPPVFAVTTPSMEGYRITRYLGIVPGEAILGTGFDRDFIAEIKDFTRGRVGEWENQIQLARQTAIVEMSQRAAAWGANAVVGVTMDYEVMGSGGSIILVTATGTAVIVARISGVTTEDRSPAP